MTLVQEIALALIDVGSNVRVDPGDLEELADSILEHGVLQPVRVTPDMRGRFRLVFGQRRVLASRQAGLTTIEAIVVPPDAGMGEGGARRATEQLVENLQRRELNPIETARAIRKVLDANRGMTQGALARSIGIPGGVVSRLLGYLELHPIVQDYLEDGRLVEHAARVIGKLPLRQQVSLARIAVRDGLPVRQIERMVSRKLHPPPKRGVRGRPRIIELVPVNEPGSRSVAIPCTTPNGRAVITIGVEGPGFVDVVVEDSEGHRLMLTLRAQDARLVGRRLQQAYQAVAS